MVASRSTVVCAKLVFLVFQENWITWDLALIFLRPLVLVSGSHLFVALPEEYRFAYFREMTSGMFPVFSALLGSTADTCSASV